MSIEVKLKEKEEDGGRDYISKNKQMETWQYNIIITRLRHTASILGRHATNTMDENMWLDALFCDAQLM